MEQFEVVLKTPEGMRYTVSAVKNGEQILRLVPVEESTDKAKHFTKITAEDREKVNKWLAKQKCETDREKSFLSRVKDAIKVVNYDYWIATLEPSVVEGKICYAKGQKVGVGFSCNQYKQMATEYAPERGSRLSNLDELFIWYALRIVNGLWTLDYVANNSSSAGNYWNAPNASLYMEKTGAKVCGGYNDGQGNTHKIVTRESGYALVGGYYNFDGYGYPVAFVYYSANQCNVLNYGTGVLVLTK